MVTTILSILGVLIGATLQYAFGRQLEDRKQLTFQKAQSYTDFFEAVASIATIEGDARDVREANSLVAASKTRMCIYGSNDVIKCLAAFEHAGATTLEAKGRDALIDLLIAMRDDIRGQSKCIDRSELNSIILGEDHG